jgi:hypothetical protein
MSAFFPALFGTNQHRSGRYDSPVKRHLFASRSPVGKISEARPRPPVGCQQLYEPVGFGADRLRWWDSGPFFGSVLSNRDGYFSQVIENRALGYDQRTLAW